MPAHEPRRLMRAWPLPLTARPRLRPCRRRSTSYPPPATTTCAPTTPTCRRRPTRLSASSSPALSCAPPTPTPRTWQLHTPLLAHAVDSTY
eukprot:scaffold78990_cov61-Phaeocystis_antarctica.AAC.3